MNTQVINEAVQAHNADLLEATKSRAIGLITEINEHKRHIQGCEERIQQSREALDTLAKNVVDENSVFGGSLPANANKETITKVIEAANKTRQFEVEQKAQRLTAAINNEQDAIRSIEKSIVDLRKQLAELEPPTVTVTEIVG
jgi:uncharacterized coiled-coil DUF342 family protein